MGFDLWSAVTNRIPLRNLKEFFFFLICKGQIIQRPEVKGRKENIKKDVAVVLKY